MKLFTLGYSTDKGTRLNKALLCLQQLQDGGMFLGVFFSLFWEALSFSLCIFSKMAKSP